MPDPTAEEQLTLEYLNLLRTNPPGEYGRLTNTSLYTQIASAVAFFGINLTALQQQLAALPAVAPLAWNASLAAAAQGHNARMIAGDSQSHQLPGEPGLGARAMAAGYNGSFLGENVFAYSQGPFYGHAGFVIDWGYDSGDYDASGNLLPDWASRGDGMQDPPGHRSNLTNASFTEIGIAITPETDSRTSVGPYVTTEDLGTRPGYAAQVLGVVTKDLDGDHLYDVGEGLGGVGITLSGGGQIYTTTSWASGGWQIAVPAGTYAVHFAGGSLVGAIDSAFSIGAQNIKLDVEAAQAHPLHASQDAGTNDFNGDGRSDILWRNASGAVVDFLAAGSGFVGNVAFYGVLGTDWHVAGTGDFNGDGRSDILWRNDDGGYFDWLASGSGFFSNATSYGVVGTEWRVAGTADFDGDGRSDILWRNADGAVVDFLATDTGFIGNAAFYGVLGTEWQVAGTGDFNGDGRSDILWRNADGGYFDWLASGDGFVGNVASYGVVGTDWRIAGTGDFNGDGRSDILWRNANGAVVDFLATDTGFVGNAAFYAVVGTEWHVAGTGDYNGDGRSDILWRSDNGGLTDWLASGDGFVTNDASYGVVGTDWRIEPGLLG